MFQGRYGNDHLNRALSLLGLVFMALGMVFRWQPVVSSICSAFMFACVGVFVFRMFSRNFSARTAENARFLAWWTKVKAKWQAAKRRGPKAKVVRNANPTFEERRKYKYFVCMQCAQRLRVPRGKGKLLVTCTRCGHKFEMKS